MSKLLNTLAYKAAREQNKLELEGIRSAIYSVVKHDSDCSARKEEGRASTKKVKK